jgi:hypothetical protein
MEEFKERSDKGCVDYKIFKRHYDKMVDILVKTFETERHLLIPEFETIGDCIDILHSQSKTWFQKIWDIEEKEELEFKLGGGVEPIIRRLGCMAINSDVSPKHLKIRFDQTVSMLEDPLFDSEEIEEDFKTIGICLDILYGEKQEKGVFHKVLLTLKYIFTGKWLEKEIKNES